jgi:hypothetical protein
VFGTVLAALWAVVGLYLGRQYDRAVQPAAADEQAMP